MNAPVERGLARLLAGDGADGHRFLMPGEWYFGAEATSVATLLGSCVAVTLWHPQRRLGGMCHYLVPSRGKPAPGPLDGRYGDEAIALLRRAVAAAGTRPREYRVLVFGGANMFSGIEAVTLDVGARNVEAGLAVLDRHGFHVAARDVGGTSARRVELDFASGRPSVRVGG